MRRSTLSVSSAGNFMISPLFAGVATETPPPPPTPLTVSAAYSTYCSSCPPDPCVEFMCVSSSSADVETATGCLLSINKAVFRMMPSHNKPTRTWPHRSVWMLQLLKGPNEWTQAGSLLICMKRWHLHLVTGRCRGRRLSSSRVGGEWRPEGAGDKKDAQI